MSNRVTDFDEHLGSGVSTRADKAWMAAAKMIISEQQTMIEQLTTPKIKIPKRHSKRLLSDGKSFIRVVAADMHGSKHDPAVVSAFIGDVAILKPRELIILGDFADCGGFLAEHHTLHYIEECEYNYAEDITVCNGVLDQLQKLCAKIILFEGNHERRIETWCVTTALKQRSDREFIMSKLADSFLPGNMMHLAERGIEYIRQGKKYDDLLIPATIRRGKSVYTHTAFEKSVASYRSSMKHLEALCTNVAFGHTHRAEMIFKNTGVNGETIIARNPGCLCRKIELWQHSEPNNWTNGYNAEIVNEEDDRFISIHIPIVNGESLLPSILGMLV